MTEKQWKRDGRESVRVHARHDAVYPTSRVIPRGQIKSTPLGRRDEHGPLVHSEVGNINSDNEDLASIYCLVT